MSTINPTTTHHDQPTAKEQWIKSLTDIVTVHPWHDPVVEANPLAVPTNSDEAMIFWTPSVGCLAMTMAFRFSSYAAQAPSTWAVDAADIEAGTERWRMPWHCLADLGTPVNADGRGYRGVNSLVLPLVAAGHGWDREFGQRSTRGVVMVDSCDVESTELT